MFFSISKKELQAALKKVAGIVEKSPNDIYGCVLMSLEYYNSSHSSLVVSTVGFGRMASYSQLLDNSKIGDCVIDSESSYRFVVDLKNLQKICSKLSDTIVFDVNEVTTKEGEPETVCTLKSGKSKVTLKTQSVDEFLDAINPLVCGIESSYNRFFEISQRELKKRIDTCTFAMGEKDTREYLNGMYLSTKEAGKLLTVATNGHIMAILGTDFDSENVIQYQDENAPLSSFDDDIDVESKQKLIDAIIPRTTVLELSKNLELVDNAVKVTVDIRNRFCSFVLPNGYSLVSVLVDGAYPDYMSVMPVPTNFVNIATQDLKQAVLHTQILSNEKYRGIRLQLSKNLLKVVARNPEEDEACEEIDAVYDGADIEIGVNADYLSGVLNAITTTRFNFGFTNPNESLLFTPEMSQYDEKYIVMPMRL